MSIDKSLFWALELGYNQKQKHLTLKLYSSAGVFWKPIKIYFLIWSHW